MPRVCCRLVAVRRHRITPSTRPPAGRNGTRTPQRSIPRPRTSLPIHPSSPMSPSSVSPTPASISRIPWARIPASRLATSPDSMTWSAISSLTVSTATANGDVLRGRPGMWDENLETPLLMKTLSGYMLYYSGYRDATSPAGLGKGFPASLGLATSRDGLTFTRAQSDPVLAPTPGTFDADAIYSPDIIPYQSGYLMVYAGHCYKDCPGAPGVRILGATSVRRHSLEQAPATASRSKLTARMDARRRSRTRSPNGSRRRSLSLLHRRERQRARNRRSPRRVAHQHVGSKSRRHRHPQRRQLRRNRRHRTNASCWKMAQSECGS